MSSWVGARPTTSSSLWAMATSSPGCTAACRICRLAQAAPLYLLDEPLAHLDLNHQMAVLELFAGAARDHTAGVVMVLHDPALAHRFCDRALLIDGDGHCELGAVDAVLTAEKLSALYGYPLRQCEQAGRRWFVPA